MLHGTRRSPGRSRVDHHLLTTDTGHVEPLDPTIAAGRFAVNRIDAIIYDRPEPEWWLEARAMRVEIENGTEVDAAFAQVSIRTDAEVTSEEFLAGGGSWASTTRIGWMAAGSCRSRPVGSGRWTSRSSSLTDLRGVLPHR
jgi:hypothetical protein